MPRSKQRRQLHVWLNVSDYAFIKRVAKRHDESVSRLLRRLITNWQKRSSTTDVPKVAADRPSGEATSRTPKRS